MKKVNALLIVLTMVLMTVNSSVAYAAETEVTVTAGEMEVRELSQEEMEVLAGELELEMIGEETLDPMATAASYTAYEYAQTFDFSLNGSWVAQADAVCIVWHYTDGKVHLYQRTITVTRLATYDASRTYGRIVNTDGSLSYTTGDRVHLYGLTSTWDYAIDFRVTPTDAAFDCYEV